MRRKKAINKPDKIHKVPWSGSEQATVRCVRVGRLGMRPATVSTREPKPKASYQEMKEGGER
jgi:hypothetical protein